MHEKDIHRKIKIRISFNTKIHELKFLKHRDTQIDYKSSQKREDFQITNNAEFVINFYLAIAHSQHLVVSQKCL